MPLTVVLVQPEIPQNVGFVARTMKCYHLKKLYIVHQKPYLKTSPAFMTGAIAKEILEDARNFPDLPSALNNLDLAFGFTRRRREPGLRVRAWTEILTSTNYAMNLGLVFGCESQGLSREDCTLLQELIRIETPNTALSLNLSHAVALVLHDIFSHGLITQNPLIRGKNSKVESPGPTLGESRDTFEEMGNFLRKKGAFPKGKGQAQWDNFRRLWNRACPDAKELDFLKGLIHKSLK